MRKRDGGWDKKGRRGKFWIEGGEKMNFPSRAAAASVQRGEEEEEARNIWASERKHGKRERTRMGKGRRHRRKEEKETRQRRIVHHQWKTRQRSSDSATLSVDELASNVVAADPEMCFYSICCRLLNLFYAQELDFAIRLVFQWP